MDWNKLWNDITAFFTNNVWAIIGFFATLVLGLILIKIVYVAVKRIFARTKMEKIAQQFVLAIIKFLLYLVLILCLLSVAGVEISGIITAVSATLLAVGMALQNNIANLANGIIIVSGHMFKKGDYIIVEDREGSIVDINFLFVTLMTTDNKRITIPNSIIVNNAVVNSGANAQRRVDFTFSVAYESDVELVKKIVTDCMLSNGKVYDTQDKKPFCRLKTLGASSLDFFANCWCDTEDYWDVYYYVMETVYNEFKKHNISVPYNQLEVRQRTDTVDMPFVDGPLPQRCVRNPNRRNWKSCFISTDTKRKRLKRKLRKTTVPKLKTSSVVCKFMEKSMFFCKNTQNILKNHSCYCIM